MRMRHLPAPDLVARLRRKTRNGGNARPGRVCPNGGHVKNYSMLLASLFVFTMFGLAQPNCYVCAHTPLGDAYCKNNTGCGCTCEPINMGGQHVCGLCGTCVVGRCTLPCDGPAGLTAEQRLAKDMVSHPWIMDTTTAEVLKAQSNAMSVVFGQTQQFVKTKHWHNFRGWSSTSTDPADPAGWVTFELISRDDGASEIRLTYEKSNQHERLLITPDKAWLLFRAVPDSDHVFHEELLSSGATDH